MPFLHTHPVNIGLKKEKPNALLGGCKSLLVSENETRYNMEGSHTLQNVVDISNHGKFKFKSDNSAQSF